MKMWKNVTGLMLVCCMISAILPARAFANDADISSFDENEQIKTICYVDSSENICYSFSFADDDVSETLEDAVRLMESSEKLAVPRNLHWETTTRTETVSQNGNNRRYNIYPGFIAWETYGDTNSYNLTIYNAANQVVHSTRWSTNYGAGESGPMYVDDFLMQVEESGTYTFSVQAVQRNVYNGDDSGNSEVIHSGSWSYTRPSAALPKPTGVTLNGTDLSWNQVQNADGYQVEYTFSETLDGEQYNGGSSWGRNGCEYTLEDISSVLNQGAGYYHFRVRALSNYIEQICNSPWSDTITVYSDGSSVTFGENLHLDNVVFSYQSTINGTRSYSGLVYDDEWFLQDSYIYNHELATMSLGLSMAGFEPEPYDDKGWAHIVDLYQELGFFNPEDIDGGGYEGYGTEDNGTVAFVVGAKTIYKQGDPVTLIAVTLRGGGYGDGGWAGNFEVGSNGAYHSGFYQAADYVTRQITHCMEKNDWLQGNTRIWLTGYSRSAATANLVSQLLSVRGICKRENIYTYTFATPSNQLINYFSSSYNNIFNIVNPIDIVPMVPPTKWNFGKQGTTYFTPYFANAAGVSFGAFEEKFRELSGYSDYICADGQPALIADLLDMLLNTINSRLVYYSYMQSPLVGFKENDYSKIDAIFGGKTTVGELKSLVNDAKYAKAAKRVLAVISYRKSAFGNSDPYLKLLDTIYGLFKQLAGQYAFYVIGTPVGTSEADFVMDIVSDKFESAALMQHWPEVYMAWMLTCDKTNLTESNTYKTKVAAVKCPVDVEVYDETGNLVARTTTDTYTIEDEETGEVFTDTYTVLDQEVTTLEAFVLGDSKYFTLPDDQNYRIEIVTNGNYSSGDTMTYSVTEYNGADQTSAVVYEAVELTEDSTFSAAVTTPDNEIETCTLSSHGDFIEPTEVIVQSAVKQTITDLNVELDGNAYSITGQTSSLSQNAIIYCATFNENGKMLSIGSQQFSPSATEFEIQFSVKSSNSDGYLKIFVLDSIKGIPLDDSITVHL